MLGGGCYIVPDFSAALAHDIRGEIQAQVERANAGALSPEGARPGVPYWLSCCHALMNAIVAERASAERAGTLLCDMARLASSGLGVASHKVEEPSVALHPYRAEPL